MTRRLGEITEELAQAQSLAVAGTALPCRYCGDPAGPWRTVCGGCADYQPTLEIAVRHLARRAS